jgi:hypothetical protein
MPQVLAEQQLVDVDDAGLERIYVGHCPGCAELCFYKLGTSPRCPHCGLPPVPGLPDELPE